MELLSPSLGLIFWLVTSIILIIIPVIALIDIFKNKFENKDKLIWFLVTIIIPVFGAISYFIIGRKQRIKK